FLYFLCTIQDSFKVETHDNNLFYSLIPDHFVLKGWHKGQPYTKDTKVKNFIQWMKTQHEADQMKKTVIGGYYPFPRPPNNFLRYCKNNKVESILKAIGEMGSEIEDLHYREHKRIAIQGIISAIRYISCSSVAEDASGEEPAQVLSTTSKEDSAHKERNRNLKNKEVKSPLGGHCSPGEQHQRQAFLTRRRTIKRKITRSFHQDGMNDIPETEETGRTCDSWQSDLWTQVKDKLMKYLHHSTVFPESIPRKFDYVHKDLLMQLYNLHAAVHQPKEHSSDKNINEFKSASGLGHYEVTVLGINHDVAIDVAFLPLFCPEDTHLFQTEDIQNDTLLSCMSCISACPQKTTSTGGLHGETVKAAMDLDGKHVICILDICHLGDDKVEVFLSKIYKTVEPDVLDPV
uniref:Uncharacterized protein n=1 Tax=Nothoprocta perdicaria TaxID=30464 RepID=A0A8C6Z0I9_NOTPE